MNGLPRLFVAAGLTALVWVAGVPAALAAQQRTADGTFGVCELVNWKETLRTCKAEPRDRGCVWRYVEVDRRQIEALIERGARRQGQDGLQCGEKAGPLFVPIGSTRPRPREAPKQAPPRHAEAPRRAPPPPTTRSLPPPIVAAPDLEQVSQATVEEPVLIEAPVAADEPMSAPADAPRAPISTADRSSVGSDDLEDLINKDLRYADLFYGTNRARGEECGWTSIVNALTAGGCGVSNFYAGAERNEPVAEDNLEVGRLRVTFPPQHELGKVERPTTIFGISLRKEDPDKDVVLAEIVAYGTDVDRWTADLRSTGKKSGYIFVHGFNTTFEEAAWRAAQIAYDIDFEGLPMLYSWPSQGGTFDYFRDQTIARELSVAPFKRFLRLVADHGGLDELHVVAHSMGNQVVLNAIKELSDELAGGAEPPASNLAQLILAAPDVDADVFVDNLADKLPKVFDRVTVYVSDSDEALQKSKEVRRGRPRAGDVEGGLLEQTMPGIEVVDASGVKTDFLAHSYYANNDSVRSDLFCLMTAGVGASARPLLEDRQPSWKFKPLPGRATIDAAACDVASLGATGGSRRIQPEDAGGGLPTWVWFVIAAAALGALALWFVRR